MSERIGKFLTVTFLPSHNGPPKRKTGIWAVHGDDGNCLLGLVKWYGPWRQYTFEPEENTVYHRGCLEDIAAFLKRVNDEHRAEVAARKKEK